MLLTLQTRFHRLRKFSMLPLWLGLGAGAISTLPVWGAERIQFFYGPFEATIPVEELEAIAIDGAATDADGLLAARLNEEQLTSLQEFLNTDFDIDVVMMSRLSYSDVGAELLHRLGQIIQTESGANGAQAIRAALTLAAADEAGLTVLNVIQQFPLETIQLNLPLVQKVVAENQAIFRRQTEVIDHLQQQAQSQAENSAELVSTSTGDLRQSGVYPWRRETVTFINPGRPAPSVADLYLPDRTSATPVIVISHGVASNRQAFAYLAKHLASHGYAVAVLDHADTNTEKFERFLTGLEGPPDPQSLLNRPRDVSALLDALEQTSELQRLTLESVGVLGHSLGGYTALAAAGAELQRHQLTEVCGDTVAEQPLLNLSMLLQCRFLELPETANFDVQDDRVQAVMAINPLTSHLFGSKGMGALSVPTLLVAATDDYFVPALPEQIEPFESISAEDKYLVVIENATHFTPLDFGEQVLPAPDFLVGPDPASAQPALQALTLAFFNRHLSELPDYSAFLNQAYLNQLASDPFQFSIVQQYSQP
ncbi:MAG: alpha/beta hydrolase [Leptolyngbya sp. SIO1E4]|nr:alpha/beta hydrolase [Leptolyngbya sp. SIO1E4]